MGRPITGDEFAKDGCRQQKLHIGVSLVQGSLKVISPVQQRRFLVADSIVFKPVGILKMNPSRYLHTSVGIDDVYS